MPQLSEQEIIRRQALEEMINAGINPFPAEMFEVNCSAKEIKQNYGSSKIEYKNVSIAGRLMMKRIMGKASFAEMQDSTGKIQLYIQRDDICTGENKDNYNVLFKKWLDLGDHIGVTGFVFTTQTGETTIHVKELKLLGKTLRPLPVVKEKDGIKYDEFTDPEMRYRMRYVDLVVNPEIKNVFIQRSKLTSEMRKFLNEKGFLEVETPALQPMYGGAAARPFTTHHNALDSTFYMRIADELYLKRLIVGGFDGVYEIAKDFRNEGMDRTHNPEFTMMELYVAYKDYLWMADLVEEMVEHLVIHLHGKTTVSVYGNEINFARPWKRYTMYEAIQHYTGTDVANFDEKQMADFARSIDIHVDQTMGRGKLIDEIFGEKCEPNLLQPTFITDYPIEMSPLAKKHRSKPGLVERFEVICNGKELCNAFSELNDPIDQRKRFEEQLELGKRGDEEAMMLDEDFLRALEYGMPPTSGLGIGMDRLCMILTDQRSIQDVIFFPQMRPEKFD